MYNSFKSIYKILEETQSVISILKEADLYYAHVSSDNSKPPELINEHFLLVQNKFNELVEIHKLDEIVNSLIQALFTENKLPFNSKVFEFIKISWVNTVVFHDYGKVNENFQAHPEKMNNPSFKGKEVINSPISTHHSSLGAYLFLIKHIELLDESKSEVEYDNLLSSCIIYFSLSIFKHHGKYLNNDVNEKISFSQQESEFMARYLQLYHFEISKQTIENIANIGSAFYSNRHFNKYLNSFSLYSLIRISFSLLTASDFLASGQYMTGIEVSDFGVLSRMRIEEIYEYISQSEWLIKSNGKVNYNRSTFTKAKEEYHYQNPKDLSNNNLNILREEMGIEVLQTIRNHSENNLFYIEAPTGGGKTNLAFLATIELLKLNKNLNKVFYVFPFTTLVTQTQKSLLETFGLSSDEVITLSSKSGFKEKLEQNKESNIEDDQYGSQKRFYLDNLFCLFPFCLLTHVKFFNILKTNEKEENYLLHRLANSIVVLDEMQAYSPNVWDKVIYFIKNYAHFYNIKFIVMSATLPKLGTLKIEGLHPSDFTELISNSNQRYFCNPNFSKRVSFNLDLFDSKNLTLDSLADLLIEKSKEYSLLDFGLAKPKGSVYTIIEFIFKKTATEFYSIIKLKESFFDEVFVLSGTILEHRRKFIINFLKNQDNRRKKILLITTQVVEAGVDIDMDLGFKDKSIIDSDEQLAGRINRNINKDECVLHIFNYNNEKIIYGRDKRYETTRDILKEEYLEILQTKNFNKIYDKVLDGIDKWNTKEGAVGFYEYEQNIKKLKFQSTHFDFNIINKEQENLTLFIPMAIPILVPGNTGMTNDEVFAKNEVAFLKKYSIYPNHSNKIEGAEVFDLYLNLLQQKGDISLIKIDNKIMQGIMSKFLIQLLGTNSLKSKLIEFQDVTKSDKGYIYLSRWNEPFNHPLYNEYFGLDDSSFTDVETQFL